MPIDWQTPLALLTVACAAGWLLHRAWRERRRAAARGCGSAGEGCGCGIGRRGGALSRPWR